MNRIMRVLNVAEKNDAAKMLAKTMSREQCRKREGLSKYNKVFEFSLNLFGTQCQMIMTSVSGHMMNFDFGFQYKNWSNCDPLVLFTAPVIKQCTHPDVYKSLQKEVRGCQKLIIWTDCDREGENIGYEVIEACKEANRNIDIYRARFSEITTGAVNRALANLVRPDQRVSDAVEVRQELDLRIGAAFTRFQTLRLRQVFPDVLGDQVISYGSCQFPTLGFVVERYKEIEAFISEPFWKLKVIDSRDGLTVEFSWKRGRLFDQEMCKILHELCLEDPKARVTKVQSKPKSKWRPVAMDTVELEKLASRKLRIGAKETMKIAEKLYTQGFISYPRTETNIFPKDLDLVPLVRCQTNDQRWGNFAARVLEAGVRPRNGKKSDQAHPPIHPLKPADSVHGNEARIYELITRHFLACLSADAVGEETVVEIEVNKEEFETKGLTIRERNYLEIYIYESWSDRELPVYRQHEVFEPSAINMVDGATTAPPLLTEADLITLMEKHGIGTDATHADHIETIKKRNYVGLEDGKSFIPGELGMGLVEGYDAMGFHMSKPHLRAELERDLKLICDGVKDKEAVLTDQIEKYKQVFVEAVAQDKKIYEALSNVMNTQPTADYLPTYGQGFSGIESVRRCHQCSNDMIIRRRRNGEGFFVSCSGFPACKNALWLPDTVTAIRVGDQCPNHEDRDRVMMVALKLRRSAAAPVFRESEEYVGCLECDTNLSQVLGVKYSVGRSVANNENSAPIQRPQAAVAGTRQLPSRPVRDGGGDGDGDGDGEVQCGCGLPAVERTVQKEGPNRGRKFLSCSSRSCNFFQWADGQNTTSNQRPPNFPATTNNQRLPDVAATRNNGDVVCKCGNDAKQLTVMKDSPNKGRPFYVCAKPRGQGCDFFQWADEAAPPRTGNRPPDRPRAGGGRGGGGRGQGTKQRLCGICRQAGHTRNNCSYNVT